MDRDLQGQTSVMELTSRVSTSSPVYKVRVLQTVSILEITLEN